MLYEIQAGPISVKEPNDSFYNFKRFREEHTTMGSVIVSLYSTYQVG